MTEVQRFHGKTVATLSHEIFELLLQLRILVVDAPHDGVLEGTAKRNRGARLTRASFPSLESQSRLLTFPGGSGTARKIWHGYISPVSSPDSSQTTRTRWGETKHGQKAPPTLNMYAHTCSAHRLVVVRGMQRRNLTQSTRARCFIDGFKRKGRRSSLTTTSSLFDPRTHMAFYCWLSGKKQFFEATYGSTRDVSQASRAGLGISGCDP